jgi:hypothetical protein
VAPRPPLCGSAWTVFFALVPKFRSGTHASKRPFRVRAATKQEFRGSTFPNRSLGNLVRGFEPPVGSAFEIVTNTGTGPTAGTFNGLDEGTVFTQGGYQFQITYHGGTGGSSVVLTRLP